MKLRCCLLPSGIRVHVYKMSYCITLSRSDFLYPISTFFVSNWHCPSVLQNVLNHEYSIYIEDRGDLCRSNHLSKEQLNMLRKPTLKSQSKLNVCSKRLVSLVHKDDGRIIKHRL